MIRASLTFVEASDISHQPCIYCHRRGLLRKHRVTKQKVLLTLLCEGLPLAQPDLASIGLPCGKFVGNCKARIFLILFKKSTGVISHMQTRDIRSRAWAYTNLIENGTVHLNGVGLHRFEINEVEAQLCPTAFAGCR